MRSLPLLAGFSLTLALVAFVPAGAAHDACHDLKGGCPGLVCVDADDNGAYSNLECVPVDVPDRCEFQSDCCDSGIGTSFWCPEDS